MGQTILIQGIITPKDEKYKTYYDVVKACHFAGIEAPKEVCKYFNIPNAYDLEGISKDGIVESFQFCTGERDEKPDKPEYKEFIKIKHDDCIMKYDIDLEKLPKEYGKIRFYIGY